MSDTEDDSKYPVLLSSWNVTQRDLWRISENVFRKPRIDRHDQGPYKTGGTVMGKSEDREAEGEIHVDKYPMCA